MLGDLLNDDFILKVAEGLEGGLFDDLPLGAHFRTVPREQMERALERALNLPVKMDGRMTGHFAFARLADNTPVAYFVGRNKPATPEATGYCLAHELRHALQALTGYDMNADRRQPYRVRQIERDADGFAQALTGLRRPRYQDHPGYPMTNTVHAAPLDAPQRPEKQDDAGVTYDRPDPTQGRGDRHEFIERHYIERPGAGEGEDRAVAGAADGGDAAALYSLTHDVYRASTSAEWERARIGAGEAEAAGLDPPFAEALGEMAPQMSGPHLVPQRVAQHAMDAFTDAVRERLSQATGLGARLVPVHVVYDLADTVAAQAMAVRDELTGHTSVWIELNGNVREGARDLAFTLVHEIMHADQFINGHRGATRAQLEESADNGAEWVLGYRRPGEPVALRALQALAAPPPAFYSKAARWAASMRKPMPAEAIRSQLGKAGVGKDEMRWMGLADLLDRGGTISPADLREEIAQGVRVQIAEEERPKWRGMSLPGGENYREITVSLPERSVLKPERPDMPEFPENWNGEDSPDYRRYREAYERYKRELEHYEMDRQMYPFRYHAANLMSGAAHFGPINTLLHLRTQDFTAREDQEGHPLSGRVLMGLEAQSDWHQKRRNPYWGAQDGNYLRRVHELLQEKRDLDTRYGVDRGSFMNADGAYYRRTQEIRDELARMARLLPEAPFAESWPRLAMRVLLHKAVSEGYDWVALPADEETVRTIEDWGRATLGAGELSVIRHTTETLPNTLEKIAGQWGTKGRLISIGRATEFDNQVVHPRYDVWGATDEYDPASYTVHAWPITAEMRASVNAGQSLFARVAPGRLPQVPAAGSEFVRQGMDLVRNTVFEGLSTMNRLAPAAADRTVEYASAPYIVDHYARTRLPRVTEGLSPEQYSRFYPYLLQDRIERLRAKLEEERAAAIRSGDEKAFHAAEDHLNSLTAIPDPVSRQPISRGMIRAYLGEPGVKEAVERHKELVQPIMQGAFEESGYEAKGLTGLFSGAFVPGVALGDDGEPRYGGGGGGRGGEAGPKGEFRKVPGSGAFRGTARAYAQDYNEAIRGRMDQAVRAVLQRQMVRSWLDCRVAVAGGDPEVKRAQDGSLTMLLGGRRVKAVEWRVKDRIGPLYRPNGDPMGLPEKIVTPVRIFNEVSPCFDVSRDDEYAALMHSAFGRFMATYLFGLADMLNHSNALLGRTAIIAPMRLRGDGMLDARAAKALRRLIPPELATLPRAGQLFKWFHTDAEREEAALYMARNGALPPEFPVSFDRRDPSTWIGQYLYGRNGALINAATTIYKYFRDEGGLSSPEGRAELGRALRKLNVHTNVQKSGVQRLAQRFGMGTFYQTAMRNRITAYQAGLGSFLLMLGGSLLVKYLLAKLRDPERRNLWEVPDQRLGEVYWHTDSKGNPVYLNLSPLNRPMAYSEWAVSSVLSSISHEDTPYHGAVNLGADAVNWLTAPVASGPIPGVAAAAAGWSPHLAPSDDLNSLDPMHNKAHTMGYDTWQRWAYLLQNGLPISRLGGEIPDYLTDERYQDDPQTRAMNTLGNTFGLNPLRTSREGAVLARHRKQERLHERGAGRAAAGSAGGLGGLGGIGGLGGLGGL